MLLRYVSVIVSCSNLDLLKHYFFIGQLPIMGSDAASIHWVEIKHREIICTIVFNPHGTDHFRTDIKSFQKEKVMSICSKMVTHQPINTFG